MLSSRSADDGSKRTELVTFRLASLQRRKGAGRYRSISHQTIALRRNKQTAMGHARQGREKGTADLDQT